MKFVKIDPPGSWCHYQALNEMIALCGGETFLDVGCGAGDFSKRLCDKGYKGIGIDFSEKAVAQAAANMAGHIEASRYRLFCSDIADFHDSSIEVDLGLSLMVMEHIENDVGFVQSLAQFVRLGGHVLIAVPGRRDCWGIEDETVGHVRRYDNSDLKTTLEQAGLIDVTVWSVAVPVGNILFSLSNLLVSRSGEVEKKKLSMREQTETSGIREIPYKTVFPTWCRLVLNRYALAPLFVVQRLFYKTNLGLTMLGCGRVTDDS